jgi:hypothetical protein
VIISGGRWPTSPRLYRLTWPEGYRYSTVMDVLLTARRSHQNWSAKQLGTLKNCHEGELCVHEGAIEACIPSRYAQYSWSVGQKGVIGIFYELWPHNCYCLGRELFQDTWPLCPSGNLCVTAGVHNCPQLKLVRERFDTRGSASLKLDPFGIR